MESAEESGFLRDGADDALDDLLEKEFPTLKSSRSNFSEASTWRALASEIPYETGDFVLKPPWTLAQAHAFYFFLCQTDERRRNKERNDDEPSIPKRCVYEMLTAAYEHYDARAHEHGALQAVPPPTSSKQKLKVCGDTHGQLQDVLWIFDEHGEPGPDNAYLFNGDIADRGKYAVEIFLLLLAYQLADPTCVYINRGNHEQRDLNERPFSSGGGFAWELRGKYPHDENLVELFQRFFNALPIASIVGEWALVIHGGLFREPDITLDDIAKIDFRRPPPQQLHSRDDKLLFDSLWADPHPGTGVLVGSARGAFSATFGSDITRDFCNRNNIKSVVRSHQLPKRQRGFEILHDAMLLTIFSASNYGGACRNKGGVLIFDEAGPAEVKEFYAPELSQLRAMFEFRAAEKMREQIELWRVAAMEGSQTRKKRQQDRHRNQVNAVQWKHLLVKVDQLGQLPAEGMQLLEHVAKRWSTSSTDAQIREEIRAINSDHDHDGDGATAAAALDPPVRSSTTRKRAIRRRTLVDYMLRDDVADSTQTVTDDSTNTATSAAASTPPPPTSAAAPARQIGEVVSAHVYVEEDDDGLAADGEIVCMMLTELCKYKNSLSKAFVACEAEATAASERASGASARASEVGGGDSSRAALLRRSSRWASRTIAYSSWLQILSTYMPEFDQSLWREYGPRIAAGHCTPEVPPGTQPSAGTTVAYIGWLARFQVDLVYDTTGTSFFSSVLERLYNRLLVRTKRMPMAELFAHFDPNLDGGVERNELKDALRLLDLGLSTPQLEQLVIALNIDEHVDHVTPIQAITLLLEKIGFRVRAARRKRLLTRLGSSSALNKRKFSEATGLEQGWSQPAAPKVADDPAGDGAGDGDGAGAGGADGGGASGGDGGDGAPLTPEREAAMELKRIDLGSLIRGNMQATAKALGSSQVQAIFSSADADGNGVLSRKEATDLLVELQTASAKASSASLSAEEIEDVLALVDVDGNGAISFVEFLVAFGLNEDDATHKGTDLDESSVTPVTYVTSVTSSRMKTATSAFALTPAQGESAVGSEATSGASLDLVTQIAQSVCAALYERLHALQRAFHYLDVHGNGYISATDFEHAILLVLDKVPPRSPPGTAHLRESVKRAPAPDGAAEEVHEVSPTDIASLVASLVGSSLADGKSPPSIDYCGFVQAFVVRDVEGDLI